MVFEKYNKRRNGRLLCLEDGEDEEEEEELCILVVGCVLRICVIAYLWISLSSLVDQLYTAYLCICLSGLVDHLYICVFGYQGWYLNCIPFLLNSCQCRTPPNTLITLNIAWMEVCSALFRKYFTNIFGNFSSITQIFWYDISTTDLLLQSEAYKFWNIYSNFILF